MPVPETDDNWDLTRWNTALVRAVFDQQPGAPDHITRISTGHRFLNGLYGKAGSDDIAYQAFLHAITGDMAAIHRRLNGGYVDTGWTP